MLQNREIYAFCNIYNSLAHSRALSLHHLQLAPAAFFGI